MSRARTLVAHTRDPTKKVAGTRGTAHAPLARTRARHRDSTTITRARYLCTARREWDNRPLAWALFGRSMNQTPASRRTRGCQARVAPRPASAFCFGSTGQRRAGVSVGDEAVVVRRGVQVAVLVSPYKSTTSAEGPDVEARADGRGTASLPRPAHSWVEREFWNPRQARLSWAADQAVISERPLRFSRVVALRASVTRSADLRSRRDRRPLAPRSRAGHEARWCGSVE